MSDLKHVDLKKDLKQVRDEAYILRSVGSDIVTVDIWELYDLLSEPANYAEKIKELEEEILNLERQVSELEGDVRGLESELHNFESEVFVLEDTIEVLRSRVCELENGE